MGCIYVVGSANIDLVAPLAKLPRAGETVAGGDLAYVPGGKGANQACAAARMGGDTYLVARLGSDSSASVLIESLERAGVHTLLTKRIQGSTGTAFIFLLPAGENAIVISPGVNAALTPDAAVASLDGLTASDWVLLQLEIPLDSVEAVLRHSAKCGARTILDPAPACPLPRSVLELATILTPNQVELATLCESTREPSTVAEAAGLVRDLRARGAQSVIAKLGAAGCYVSGDGFQTLVPGFAVEAVDTTAAGDVFNGALAAALDRGYSLIEGARVANGAAALSVTRLGAQSSIPTREEVDVFLAPSAVKGASDVHH